MMMYPFFYRPQSLKLEEGWNLFPLEQYFQQIASQVSLEGRDPARLGGEVTPCTRAALPAGGHAAGEAPEAAPHPASPPDEPVAAERREPGFHHLPHVPSHHHRAGSGGR